MKEKNNTSETRFYESLKDVLVVREIAKGEK